MAKFVSIEEAVAVIPSGSSLMIAGFMGCGSAHRLIDALSKSDKNGFTIISNDAAMPGGFLNEENYGVAKLVHNRQIKHLIATHVGLNPEVKEQVNQGFLELTLIPQGSMAEMIRAGGSGLGGIITPTGVGTIVEEGWHVHSKVTIENETYLIERPLRADFAIISGFNVDQLGNVWYKGAARNFNPLMATAANVVIVEADNLVEVGEIEPENIATPYVLVDYIAR